MTTAGSPAPPPPDDPGRTGGKAPSQPAADLGDVWGALDLLPRASGSEMLAATTLELVAANAAGSMRRADRPTARPAWIAPAAVIAGCFVIGGLVGRATAPDPDRALIAALPVVRHLDLLREAGSTSFLTAVNQKGAPRPGRLLVRLGPEALERQATEFRAALETLRHDLEQAAESGDESGATRADIQALPLEKRVELERAVREFQRLSTAEQRMLRELAQALVDPARPALGEAALTWHQWLALARPEDRAEIIGGSTPKRLEWLDWYGRIESGRGERPPRPPEGPDRRGGPEGRPGMDRRGPPDWRGTPDWRGPDGLPPRPPRKPTPPVSPAPDPPPPETSPAPR